MPVPGLSFLGLKRIRGFVSILRYINPTIIIIIIQNLGPLCTGGLVAVVTTLKISFYFYPIVFKGEIHWFTSLKNLAWAVSEKQ